jgi:hypothetical protein
VPRFSEDGPKFSAFDLRVTYRLPLGSKVGADFMADLFNLFNHTNYDVNSVLNNQYVSGPTPTAPTTPLVANTSFRQYTATLPPFGAQLGVRVTF